MTVIDEDKVKRNHTEYLSVSDFQHGRLTLETQNIIITGYPRVTLLLGENEDEQCFFPDAKPTYLREENKDDYEKSSSHIFSWNFDGDYELIWTIKSFSSRPVVEFSASIKNLSKSVVKLKNIYLFKTDEDAVKYQGSAKDWFTGGATQNINTANLKVKMKSANDKTREMWAAWKMPIPFALSNNKYKVDGRWRSYGEFFTLQNKNDSNGLCFGPTGEPKAFIFSNCFVDNGSLMLELLCEMNGILLKPNATINAQSLSVAAMPRHDGMKYLFSQSAKTHNARAKGKKMSGWCSWYDLEDKITAKHVLGVIKSIKDNQQRLSFDVIQVDDGFQRQVGDWECNAKFPEGWKPIIKAINDTGAMPGIWLAPLAVHESTAIFKEHPDWFQRDKNGELVDKPGNWGGASFWLDPSHPKVKSYIHDVVSSFREAGFKYFKIDFNTLRENTHYYDQNKTRFEIYRQMYQIYRDAIGEDNYFLGCCGLTRSVVGYVDAMRIGGDTTAVWKNENESEGCTIKGAIRSIGLSAEANGIWAVNDPDVTYLRPRTQVNHNEWFSWHSFIGLLGGLNFISEPLHNV